MTSKRNMANIHRRSLSYRHEKILAVPSSSRLKNILELCILLKNICLIPNSSTVPLNSIKHIFIICICTYYKYCYMHRVFKWQWPWNKWHCDACVLFEVQLSQTRSVA